MRNFFLFLLEISSRMFLCLGDPGEFLIFFFCSGTRFSDLRVEIAMKGMHLFFFLETLGEIFPR